MSVWGLFSVEKLGERARSVALVPGIINVTNMSIWVCISSRMQMALRSVQ